MKGDVIITVCHYLLLQTSSVSIGPVSIADGGDSISITATVKFKVCSVFSVVLAKYISLLQTTAAHVAYDIILSFEKGTGGVELIGFAPSIDTSRVRGGSCFEGGSIPFTLLSPTQIHIPYLLDQCRAEFVFQAEASCGG